MPLLPRGDGGESVVRASVLGEAFLTGFGEIVLQQMDHVPREKIELV